MKIIKWIVSFYILFYIIYTPIYILFFNSTDDVIEKITLISSAQTIMEFDQEYGRPNRERSERMENALERIESFAKMCEDKYDIDLYVPIYKQLKKSPNIKNVKIVYEGGDSGMSRVGAAELYKITFLKDGEQYQIPIMVRPPSFLRVQTAKAVIVGFSGGILELYGLDNKLVNRYKNIFDF